MWMVRSVCVCVCEEGGGSVMLCVPVDVTLTPKHCRRFEELQKQVEAATPDLPNTQF